MTTTTTTQQEITVREVTAQPGVLSVLIMASGSKRSQLFLPDWSSRGRPRERA